MNRGMAAFFAGARSADVRLPRNFTCCRYARSCDYLLLSELNVSLIRSHSFPESLTAVYVSVLTPQIGTSPNARTYFYSVSVSINRGSTPPFALACVYPHFRNRFSPPKVSHLPARNRLRVTLDVCPAPWWCPVERLPPTNQMLASTENPPIPNFVMGTHAL